MANWKHLSAILRLPFMVVVKVPGTILDLSGHQPVVVVGSPRRQNLGHDPHPLPSTPQADHFLPHSKNSFRATALLRSSSPAA
jgi:hypothetical protein